eukprot:Mrub_04863.p1 GENE.Mrub_04863~~Mrub_04863.p1  ORF type:complete len:377 (+),score=42.93 Mrub_04863:38-1168(+)
MSYEIDDVEVKQTKNEENNYDFYFQDYKVQDVYGNYYNPVLYDYSQANFNNYINNQIEFDNKQENESEESVDEEKVKKKRKKYKYKISSKIEPYWYCLMGTILLDLIFIGAHFAIWFLAIAFYAYELLIIAPAPMFFALLIKVAIMWNCTPMMSYINNMNSNSSAVEIIDKLRQAKPEPRYGIICYHYHTGQKIHEKIITKRIFRQFKYAYWADWSREIYKTLKKHRITAININRKLVFFDKKTEKHYNKMKKKMYDKHYDDDMEYELFENLHIDEFDRYYLAARSKSDIPSYFNCTYYFWGMMILAAPFYYLFWSQVATVEYNLIKVVSNKEKIKIDDTEGGEGDISSCTASDEAVENIGIRYGLTEDHKYPRAD